MTVIHGWIAMPGAEYEGLSTNGEPYSVHFVRSDAEEECKQIRNRTENQPKVVEVAIDLEALREALS